MAVMAPLVVAEAEDEHGVGLVGSFFNLECEVD